MPSRSQAGFRMQESKGISFPIPVDGSLFCCWFGFFFSLFAMPFLMSIKIKVSISN